MAEEIEIVEDFNFEANQVASRTLDRKFGREEDYAELHVLTITDQIVNLDICEYNPELGDNKNSLKNTIKLWENIVM